MSVRVLLVAAHDDARASLAQRLTRSNDVDLVGAARGAREARSFTSRHPDLILLDVYDDGNSAREICRELRSAFSSPLVVLTSFMTRERWDELQAAGVSSYLLRHVNTRQLAYELSRLAAADAAGRTEKSRQPGEARGEGNDGQRASSGTA